MEKIIGKLNYRVLAAVLLFLITCAVLYAIEFVMYAGAVGTVFIYASVYPPLIILLYYAFGRRKSQGVEKPEYLRAAQLKIALFLLIVCTVFTYYYVLTGGYERLSSIQLLAAVTGLVIIAVLHKLRRVKSDISFKATVVSIIYFMILIATVLFLLITQPYTVSGARKALENSGYHDAVFIMHHRADADDIPAHAGHLGVYHFSISADGGEIDLYVDVAAREIISPD